MEQKLFQEIKNTMHKKDEFLSPYASKNEEGLRLNQESQDIRPNYFRDIDRIIYSLSYTRYIDKTQVFSHKENDHISKRMTHVQMVSKIARTIGRALSLNEDLIEASALGHDLGHPPFGHTGEAILNKISLELGLGYFNHNIQSVRTLLKIENQGKGSNLCLQTLDAIMCHNGEIELAEYYPVSKDIETFLQEYNLSYQDNNIIKKLRPMTLEGCIVRVSDIIAYIGRDIEDAIRLGIITKDDIPQNIKNILGDNNRDIINTIILDIITNSYEKPYIKISPNIFTAIKELKKFNYENIYYKANTNEDINQYEMMFRKLIEVYYYQLQNNKEEEIIYQSYLNHMSKEYRQNNSNYRIIIDYIAGMTDDYFKKQYEKYKNYQTKSSKN
ncbi:MAG: deoxyguanosinetriphosphate triphosphohydrolase family protein [Bacilli bacterium]